MITFCGIRNLSDVNIAPKDKTTAAAIDINIDDTAETLGIQWLP